MLMSGVHLRYLLKPIVCSVMSIGLGQLVVGTAETFGGGALIVGGAGLAAGGGVLEVGSVGIATPVAVPAAAAGAAAVTVGVGAIGLENVIQGSKTMANAILGSGAVTVRLRNLQ
jgi:hypothetical protein